MTPRQPAHPARNYPGWRRRWRGPRRAGCSQRAEESPRRAGGIRAGPPRARVCRPGSRLAGLSPPGRKGPAAGRAPLLWAGSRGRSAYLSGGVGAEGYRRTVPTRHRAPRSRRTLSRNARGGWPWPGSAAGRGDLRGDRVSRWLRPARQASQSATPSSPVGQPAHTIRIQPHRPASPHNPDPATSASWPGGPSSSPARSARAVGSISPAGQASPAGPLGPSNPAAATRQLHPGRRASHPGGPAGTIAPGSGTPPIHPTDGQSPRQPRQARQAR